MTHDILCLQQGTVQQPGSGDTTFVEKCQNKQTFSRTVDSKSKLSRYLKRHTRISITTSWMQNGSGWFQFILHRNICCQYIGKPWRCKYIFHVHSLKSLICPEKVPQITGAIQLMTFSLTLASLTYAQDMHAWTLVTCTAWQQRRQLTLQVGCSQVIQK